MKKRLTMLTLVAGMMMAGSVQALAATPVGVDGVIGAEWTGVTPTFVPIGPDPGAMLVAFNVYVRADASFLYVAAQALPAAGDQWDDAFNLGLGSSANIYLNTDLSNGSDLIIEALSGDYCAAFDDCAAPIIIGDPATGPSVWSVGNPGLPSSEIGGPVGGVREIAIPWTVLQTDPDSLGFAKAACSTQVRTIQAFGYNFSGSQFFDRFGTVSQPGCGGVGPPTTKDQCKKDGWKTFNVPRTFKNQGDCIQFVNTGK